MASEGGVAVGEEACARFLALYECASVCHRIRDERSLYTDVTAAGMLRTAVLHAGERVFGARGGNGTIGGTSGGVSGGVRGAKGATHDGAELLLFADAGEIEVLLLAAEDGEGTHEERAEQRRGEIVAQLKKRASYFAEADIRLAPSTINGPKPKRPPADMFAYQSFRDAYSYLLVRRSRSFVLLPQLCYPLRAICHTLSHTISYTVPSTIRTNARSRIHARSLSLSYMLPNTRSLSLIHAP
jgi:hypothetical protein